MTRIPDLRWRIIELTALGPVTIGLMRSALSSAAPTIFVHRHTELPQYYWIPAACQAGYVVALPICGYVAFVVTRSAALVSAAFWMCFHQAPGRHPMLTTEEKKCLASGPETHLAADTAKPSLRQILSQRHFGGIAPPRFLADPAWATFSFWPPLYLTSVRRMHLKRLDLKQSRCSPGLLFSQRISAACSAASWHRRCGSTWGSHSSSPDGPRFTIGAFPGAWTQPSSVSPTAPMPRSPCSERRLSHRRPRSTEVTPRPVLQL